ncbi:MAG: hypothetical protein QOJ37_2873 [Pseudonocardiales bacterium]|nr:hypothetical protein [Pseudonocardiales bacterium]
MRRLAALAAAVIGFAGVTLSVASTAAPAAAAPIGQCTISTGTIIAVDFGAFRGPIVRGCGTNPSTGTGALRDAGFGTTGTQHDGPAFICRLGNQAFQGGTQYPTDDPCINTPPATKYWSFWVAPPGQNWTYAKLGAASYRPKAGEVELWRFGGSGAPSINPASLRATNTSPSGGGGAASATGAHQARTSGNPEPAGDSTSAASSQPQGRRAAGAAHPASAHRSASATGKHSSTAARHTAAASSTTPADASGSLVAKAGGPNIVDAKPAKAPSTADSGSPWPVIAGLVLVVLLGIGAGWTALRRRRADAAAN